MSVAVKSSQSQGSQPSDEPIAIPILRRSSTVQSSLKRQKTLTAQEDKMYKSFLEAVGEHSIDAQKMPFVAIKEAKCPLFLSMVANCDQGKRTHMEDDHFDIPVYQGRLVGIFDGHGEKGNIARQVSAIFQEKFEDELEKNPDDVEKVFVDLCAHAQSQITDDSGGTTALVVYYQEPTNRCYTMTLGDSEMKLYRKIGETIFSVPASRPKSWLDKVEEARATALMKGEAKKAFLNQKDENFRYFPGGTWGINVPASLGDLRMHIDGKTAISRVPDVTLCQVVVETGVEDKMVMACDGLWKFMKGNDKEQEFIDAVLKPHWDKPNLSKRIVNYALNKLKSNDNVSVFVGTLSQVPNLEPVSAPATPPIVLESPEI
ncbi:MAG: protein phosphatase 2C domain-containing protein [Chlamydiales bacterium]|nr:protein phosphatase 2C domain-containing protein [Chlamydiales bacterium]